jgi:TonB family protein
MEAFAVYLLKSVIWLAGFTLIFILFLRNERFFLLNRIYLLTGILTSFFFPLISIHYTVILPVVSNFQSGSVVVSEIQNADSSIIPDLKLLLLVLYVTGVLFVFTLMIKQGRSVLRAIKKSEIISFRPAKLIKTSDYTSAFSFFSYVFVNPSITDVETKEIMNHELVHIRQKHWFDLLLVQLLCMMQWFNPLVWIYIRFIRQNHEYLADEVALQQTSDPAVYRAVLLNQIVGAPVVSLANSFNYSPYKKRFNMMKNIISSPYRKMKILLILPVFAIVLYAFATPDYKYNYADESSGNKIASVSLLQHEVKGKVVDQDGFPLPGTSVTVRGTTLGVSSDAKGSFKLDNIPEDGILIFSFVGYKSKAVKPVFTSEMTVSMVKDTVKYLNLNISTPPPPPPPLDATGDLNAPPPPPPPPPAGIKFKGDGPPPLFVVDGTIMTEAEAGKIEPDAIASVDIIKGKPATDKYGEKGKDGVAEITTKKIQAGDKMVVAPAPPPPPLNLDIKSETGTKPLIVVDGVVMGKDFNINTISVTNVESLEVLKEKSKIALYGGTTEDGVILIHTKTAVSAVNSKDSSKNQPFVVVEEMPKFPGGKDAMDAWINANLKYPAEAVKAKISGKVVVNFIVSSAGKVKNVVISKSVSPLLNAEAIRVISSMPEWKPASQGGKPVDVQIMVPVEFKLN